MNCSICNKPIHLSPSAAERAAKDVTGKTAAYYTSLFRTHTECELVNRHAPYKHKPIAEYPAIHQNEALLWLRHKVFKTIWGWCGSEEAAQKVNDMNEEELLKYL